MIKNQDFFIGSQLNKFSVNLQVLTWQNIRICSIISLNHKKDIDYEQT